MTKRFHPGDIVYWCGREAGKYVVKWGMVDEQYSDAVRIEFLEAKECRYIDGVPIVEFIRHQNEQKYKKLPKGWTYNTKMFDLDCVKDPEDVNLWNKLSPRIDDPESIKRAYDAGILVKAYLKFHGDIEADITKEGYKIVCKEPMYRNYSTHTSIRPDRVYTTYQEAQDEVDANTAEFVRQSELSDYDWSVEQIDKTLARWQLTVGATDEERAAYRKWILDMEHVEDIETRVYLGNVQWKYEKNKKWNNITL